MPVRTFSERRRALLAACALTLALAALTATAGPAAASQTEYDEAYRIGLEAYTYGLPLLETNKTFRTMTSIDVANSHGFGPVNQINSVRKLNDPKSKAVVAPGANALSSIAWLDLRKEPQVLHVPRVKDHYFVLALLDPYTNDIRNLGSVHDTKPGYYVIAGPGQHHLPIPAGTHRINVRYTRIWIIGSTQLKGKKDLPNVHRIQDGYTLTPLSKFGTDYQRTRPAHPRTKVTTFAVPHGLHFFDVLGQQLKKFPPPAADRAALREFASVGIGPGRRPSKDHDLSADTLRGLRAAAAAGHRQIAKDLESLFLADFDKHNGYLLGGFGRYGTDYTLRAVVSQIGLGAFSSSQSIFAMSATDRSRQPLDSSNSYVMHLAEMPPVNEGWSLTVYSLQGFLIRNSIHRYQFNSQSKFTRNADGSVDIYLQSTRPPDPARVRNWLPTGLPTAAGQGFEVIWRLMAPKPGRIKGILNGSGWQPPAITTVP
jgi:hypothetical protein